MRQWGEDDPVGGSRLRLDMTTAPTQHAPPGSRRVLPASPSLVDPRVMAAIGGSLAALLAGGGMLVLRSVLQVRTVPERVMEWLLLFVPLGVFEALLQRFGFDAKRYALWLAVAAMLVLLAGLGYVILRRRWSFWEIAATGLAVWLFVMVVVMPVTSAGLFAADLL